MTESSIFSDLKRIKANMIKLQARAEKAEDHVEYLLAAMKLQKETIAARDAEISELRSGLSEVLTYIDRFCSVPGWATQDARAEELESNHTEAEIDGKEEDENVIHVKLRIKSVENGEPFPL